MTPEQKAKIISYATHIDGTALELGRETCFKNRVRNNEAWQELVEYLLSITTDEDGLLEGESIRCATLFERTKDTIDRIEAMNAEPAGKVRYGVPATFTSSSGGVSAVSVTT